MGAWQPLLIDQVGIKGHRAKQPSGLMARWQIVQIVVGHGILGRPQGALVAMRTFVFLNGGRLPARISQSVESMPLVHRVIDLRDRPELGITGQFFRSDDDNVGVRVRHVNRFLTCANNAVLSHFQNFAIFRTFQSTA